MQHVPLKWLHRFNLFLVGLDGLLFFFYWFFEYIGASEATVGRWGITPMILVIASVHAFYSLLIYPFMRKYNEWITYALSQMIFGVLFAAIIETSGNTNLWYRLGFALWVFFLSMVGPYLSIAAAALAWILLVMVIMSVTTGTESSHLMNVVLDIVVTAAAVGGWYFFKRFYVKTRDKETLELANLLEQEQVKSSVILESITDGVLVVNTAGTAQIINVAAAQLFGWSKNEVHNVSYMSLYSTVQDKGLGSEAEDSSNDVIAMTLRTGKAHQKVVQLQSRSNQYRFVDVVASPIYQDAINEGNNPQASKLVGAIAVFRDVDKQKREEQQRTEFISTASHEMRTPVAAIEGYLALAMNDKVCLIDEKARGYLQKAHGSTQHLGQLFQDLLSSAKADDGRLASHPQIVEFSGFLEKLIDDLRFAAEKKGLALEYVMGTDQNNVRTDTTSTKLIKPLYYVEVDPDRIREVITNLFDNAVKYTPSGKISVGLTGNSDVVQFYIKDTGSGIPTEDVGHLFQKFYRVDNSATRTIGGTGLGLFICKRIIELYNGRIWVKSRSGEGSTFYVNLPRMDSTEAENARIRLANTTHPAEASDRPSPGPTVVQ